MIKLFEFHQVTIVLLIAILSCTRSMGQQLDAMGVSRINGKLKIHLAADPTTLVVGYNSGVALAYTPDAYNTVLGTHAARLLNNGKYNTVFGSSALDTADFAFYNTAVGNSALSIKSGSRNTAIGDFSLTQFSDVSIQNNCGFGHSAGFRMLGNGNTCIGGRSGTNVNGSNNVSVGYESTFGNLDNPNNMNRSIHLGSGIAFYTSGGNNVYLGNSAAKRVWGFNNIILGNSAAKDETSISRTLWIENSSSSIPLLYGTFSGDRIGINCNLPQATLSVSGSIKATGIITGSAMACSSDRRLKKSIKNLENTLASVRQLRPVRYKWRQEEFPDRHFNDREQIGFIAQEVEEIYPELIHTAEDGYKSMDYSRLTVVLTKALQEIIEKNARLKTACDRLEAELEAAEKERDTTAHLTRN